MQKQELEEIEAVDLDRIFELYIEEYFEHKKKNLRNLTKNFSKVFEQDHGIFSFDDLKAIFKESLPDESPLIGYLYPRDYTFSRIFLYALTSFKNKFDINSKDFLLACVRFGIFGFGLWEGIDTPFPFIKIV